MSADQLQLVFNEWEQLKRNFSGSMQQGENVIRLPQSLVRAMPAAARKQVRDRSGSSDKLRLMDSEVAAIFDLTVNNILEVS